ncbi:opsin-5-like [Haliotis cracherodii]|uniref:opsin-5-like n=1 Tax=Haliotis cracherodii TaxID=6455 RepID=UPI0039ED9570
MNTSIDSNVTYIEDDWEYLKRIYKVTPLTDGGYFACAVYLLLVGVLATFGNLIVLHIFYKNKKLLKNPQNLFIFNLTVSDLGISLFGYPLTTTSCFAQRFLFGELGCIIQGVTTFTFALADMKTLVALSVYRYIYLCWPHLKYRLTIEFTRMVIAGLWLYSLFWTLMPLFGWSRYVLEPFGTSCSIDWTLKSHAGRAYTLCLIFFCFIVNIGIMTFSYVKVVFATRRLMKRLKATRTAVSIDEALEERNISKEHRLVWISMAMVVSFAILWSPYAILSNVFAYVDNIPPWVSTIPTMFCKSSCLLNPVIYCMFNQDFRNCVIGIFSRRRKVGDAVKSKPIRRVIVDRTREGIYIGDTEVEVRHEKRILF